MHISEVPKLLPCPSPIKTGSLTSEGSLSPALSCTWEGVCVGTPPTLGTGAEASAMIWNLVTRALSWWPRLVLPAPRTSKRLFSGHWGSFCDPSYFFSHGCLDPAAGMPECELHEWQNTGMFWGAPIKGPLIGRPSPGGFFEELARRPSRESRLCPQMVVNAGLWVRIGLVVYPPAQRPSTGSQSGGPWGMLLPRTVLLYVEVMNRWQQTWQCLLTLRSLFVPLAVISHPQIMVNNPKAFAHLSSLSFFPPSQPPPSVLTIPPQHRTIEISGRRKPLYFCFCCTVEASVAWFKRISPQSDKSMGQFMVLADSLASTMVRAHSPLVITRLSLLNFSF